MITFHLFKNRAKNFGFLNGRDFNRIIDKLISIISQIRFIYFMMDSRKSINRSMLKFVMAI